MTGATDETAPGRSAPAPRPAREDPRIAARRAAVSREAARRARRRSLLAVLVAVCVLGSVVVAVLSSALDVDRIVLDGATHTQVRDIERVAAVRRGQPILLLGLGGAAARVRALPWVATAVVTRRLPGTVQVTVTERVPVAYATVTDGAALVDGTGRVLGVASEPPPGLPELADAGRVPDPGQNLARPLGARIAERLTPGLAPRATAVRVDDAGDITVVLGDVEVRLGDRRAVAAKLRAAEAVLAIAGPVHYVDVRVAGAPVTG